MIAGAPLASRTVTGHLAEYFPISIFLTDTLTLVDSLGDTEVEQTLTESMTLVDTLMPSELETTLTEIITLKDYMVTLLDGKLVDGWRRVDRPSTSWRRVDRP